MAKKPLVGLFARKYNVGIGEAISSNRSETGFGYFKRSKRIEL